jgi:hypothetical protein
MFRCSRFLCPGRPKSHVSNVLSNLLSCCFGVVLLMLMLLGFVARRRKLPGCDAVSIPRLRSLCYLVFLALSTSPLSFSDVSLLSVSAASNDASWSLTISGPGVTTTTLTSGAVSGLMTFQVPQGTTTPVKMDSTTLTYWISADRCDSNPNGAGSPTTHAAATAAQLNVPLDSNVPATRAGACRWVGSDNHIYFYGGDPADVNPSYSDHWRWTRHTMQWVLMRSLGTGGLVNRGTRLTPSSTTYPGARFASCSAASDDGLLFLWGAWNEVVAQHLSGFRFRS